MARATSKNVAGWSPGPCSISKLSERNTAVSDACSSRMIGKLTGGMEAIAGRVDEAGEGATLGTRITQVNKQPCITTNGQKKPTTVRDTHTKQTQRLKPLHTRPGILCTN